MDKSSNIRVLTKLSETPRMQRRYHAHARILESNMTCAAVCVFNETIFIATNDIYAGFSGKFKPKASEPTTQGYLFLKKATSRF